MTNSNPKESRMLIGMLRGSGSPGPVALACAHAASMFGARFIFFNPDNVSLNNKRISALYYVAERGWVRGEFGYPDVIDNDELSRYKTNIWNDLCSHSPITTHILGGKRNVFNKLINSGLYPELLIPGSVIREQSDIFKSLDIYERIVIKPVKGAMGRDIFFIQKNGMNEYQVNIRGDKSCYSKDDISSFYTAEIKGKNFYCQRYIESKTRNGLPFDIRLHVRRGMDGLWKTVKIYARIGSGKTIASNLSTGGSIASIGLFIKHQYGEELAEKLINKLFSLAREFPIKFQKLYPDYILDALGIDIGMDHDCNMWLFEVNSFPGSRFFEIEDAIHRMGYAMFLGAQSRISTDEIVQ